MSKVFKLTVQGQRLKSAIPREVRVSQAEPQKEFFLLKEVGTLLPCLHLPSWAGVF
jgi:hypothetical protein